MGLIGDPVAARRMEMEIAVRGRPPSGTPRGQRQGEAAAAGAGLLTGGEQGRDLTAQWYVRAISITLPGPDVPPGVAKTSRRRENLRDHEVTRSEQSAASLEVTSEPGSARGAAEHGRGRITRHRESHNVDPKPHSVIDACE